jgi:hypothetical protein
LRAAQGDSDHRNKGDPMTDKQRQPDKLEKEPELRRPDETIKDLEPDQEEGDAVKGGSGTTLNYSKV